MPLTTWYDANMAWGHASFEMQVKLTAIAVIQPVSSKAVPRWFVRPLLILIDGRDQDRYVG